MFSDTVNVASRMESNSKPGRIMCSEDSYELLSTNSKDSTFTIESRGLIKVKGKGDMKCYFVNPVSVSDEEAPSTDTFQQQKLIQWNIETAEKFVKQVIHYNKMAMPFDSLQEQAFPPASEMSIGSTLDRTKTVVPINVDTEKAIPPESNLPDLDSTIKEQLADFVTAIAHMYPHNDFHNLEHSSHVTMSAAKLLESLPSENGLYRDPLAQLVIILACLVHDVDHPGVSNAQSVVEKSHLAVLYKEKSVAEQNSIDLAWTLFADVRFAELRDSICPTPVHLDRFYKLFVKSLLATDISDKDLVAARKETWKQAFLGNGSSNSDTEDEDLKANREIYQANATLELIMQAADVSHTMQQWQVYQKWNRRLFIENTRAHEAGRKLSSTAPPPSVGWFEGELGFFDFVIIPLAQRMQDVGLDQSYLTCAAQNKSQWQSKGESVVNELKRLKLKPITQASI